MASVLNLFAPPVERWFREHYAAPTPPQELGWPEIAAGRNTLILAPTGSGKTLAAFLYAINELVTREPALGACGVHTLYVSPLRALAADIERNLEAPLAGIRDCAKAMGAAVPDLRVGVRTGDTPPAERQRMLRRPPELLVTTPESLHLLLTARRSREMLRSVRYVIVDEIHTLCGEKRGSFLALLLERLDALTERSPIRIGLSATQRPLDRVARFLGGRDATGEPRPVAIVDCGMRKQLDLRVLSPVPDMRLPATIDGHAPSVWPAIYARLLELAREHTSTLIFANNRRAVERIAAEMNRLAGRRIVRAHHGSVAKEYRHEIESDLKAGRLPALVATASLELGIDMGAIDLVCQVETPTSVASALQRVGRAGHAFGARSAGRMIPKTRMDLVRMAGMARSMLRGEISEVRVPANPLDVLAQQVVAMVAVEDWRADDLYARVRRADPFQELPRASFDAVVEMMAGGYHTPAFPTLRGRILWEKSTDRLSALPGALQAAIAAGGTIPDTGQYAMVLDDGKTRLGELDEEFVFERRIGDTFVLGTGRWKIVDLRADRVVVAPSGVEEAQLPFWKGEGLGHDAEFGARLGLFAAECVRRLSRGDLAEWLEAECALDDAAARALEGFVAEQLAAGGVPDDRTVLVDVFPNEAGDLRIAIVSMFGRSFHVALWLALRAELRRSGMEPPEGIVSNDGILLRPGSIRPEEIERALVALADGGVRGRLVDELRDAPYFALRFRRNAGRALLLPRSRPGRRVPLWLQRLRSHDLLSYASAHPRFPMVVETYREILEDALPIDVLEEFLGRTARGEASFACRRGVGPSPFAAALVLDFVGKYMYEVDQPAAKTAPVDADLLGELLGSSAVRDLINGDVARVMDERLQGLADFHRARDASEVVDLLLRVGDLTGDELRARCEPEAIGELDRLEGDGRIRRVQGRLLGEERFVATDDATAYEAGSDIPRLLRRFVRSHAGRTEEEIRARYPDAPQGIESLLEGERLVRADLPGRPAAWIDGDVLVGLRRMTASSRRRETVPVPGETLAAAVLARQHVERPLAGAAGVREVLDQLAGWLAPVGVWPAILAARLEHAERLRVDPLIRGGLIQWRGASSGGTRLLGFAPAGAPVDLLPPRSGEVSGMAARVVEYLATSGASFLHQISGGLAASPAAVDETLWELTWRGWVTNDSLAAAQRAGPGRGKPTPGLGRWSAVAEEKVGEREEKVCALLSAMLARYGFASREILGRETTEVRWSEAYPLLSRMEWRGEVDRGFFVLGLSGPQFAEFGMRDALRREQASHGMRLLHVLDPALLLGDAVPASGAPRRTPGNYVVVEGGRPILAVEAHAARLTPMVDLAPEARRAALDLLPQLVRRAGQPPRLRVETWDDTPAAASEAAEDLAAVGFLRDDQAMIFYRRFGETA